MTCWKIDGKLGLSAIFDFVTGALCITICAAIFGGYSVVSSIVFHGGSMHPLVYAFLRDCLGTAILLGAAIFMERGKKREDGSPSWMMDPADFGQFFLLGFCGVYGTQAMSALTIKYTTAAFVSGVSNLQPIVMTVYAILLGLERFNIREPTSIGKIVGILITVASAAGLVFFSSGGGDDDIRSQSLNFGLGLFYFAIKMLLGPGWTITQKFMFKKYSPITLVGNGYLVGTGILLMCVIVACPQLEHWEITPSALVGIAYAGILSSGVAYALMAHINNKLGPTFVAAFMPTQALWAALFGYIFEGKTLTPLALICAGVMIVGVLVIVLSQYRESKLGLLSPFAMQNPKTADKGGGSEEEHERLLKRALLHSSSDDENLLGGPTFSLNYGGVETTKLGPERL